MTADDLRALLPLHAIGALDPDDAALVEAAVAADPAAAAELGALRDAAAAVGDGAPVVVPSARVRDRLMASVDALGAPGRFDRFAAQVAALFDVTIDKARMFLGWIDDPARWEASPLPWVRLAHLPPGPAHAGLDCGLVRMAPGSRFPWHAHRGEEVTLVLQGQVVVSDGRRLGPGDQLVVAGDHEHDFVVEAASEEYIFAVRMHGIDLVSPPKR